MVRIREASSLGRLARDARLARGMTQEELAAAVGVSRRWVSKFETRPDTAHLHLALAALDAVGLAIDVTRQGDDTADRILRQVFGD